MALDFDHRPAPQVERLPETAARPRRAAPVVVGREVGCSSTRTPAARAAPTASRPARRTPCAPPVRRCVRAVTADERDLADAVHVAGDARLVLVGGDGTVHALANVDLPVAPAGRAAARRAREQHRPCPGHPHRLGGRGARRSRGHPRARIDALHVVTPERRLFAVEGVSAGFHAAARHRYDGTNSADLVAGIARARRRAARRSGPTRSGCASTASRSSTGPPARCSCPTCRSSGSASTSTRSPTRPTAVWRRSSSTRERGGTSSGRSPRRAPGVTCGARARRGGAPDEQTSIEPLPLVADAQPLGVTTATVTVAAGRLRLVAPEVRT